MKLITFFLENLDFVNMIIITYTTVDLVFSVIGKVFDRNIIIEFLEATRQFNARKEYAEKHGLTLNNPLRFMPPSKLCLFSAKKQTCRHNIFGALKMEMPMNCGYRIVQICGFIVFGLSLLTFIYVYMNPNLLSENSGLLDNRDVVPICVGLCILMIAGLAVGIGFFWGREKMLFYEYGAVYIRNRIIEFAYDDIIYISMDYKVSAYLEGTPIAYRPVATITFKNQLPMEITNTKLANFCNKFLILQQYLIWK